MAASTSDCAQKFADASETIGAGLSAKMRLAALQVKEASVESLHEIDALISKQPAKMWEADVMEALCTALRYSTGVAQKSKHLLKLDKEEVNCGIICSPMFPDILLCMHSLSSLLCCQCVQANCGSVNSLCYTLCNMRIQHLLVLATVTCMYPMVLVRWVLHFIMLLFAGRSGSGRGCRGVRCQGCQ